MSARPEGKRLGVVGTMVWDTIHRKGRAAVEEWGGIAYGLGGLSAALTDEWRIVPLLKVGADVRKQAEDFFRSLPAFDGARVRYVDEPNNRVELVYYDDARRTERLSGGVPPWTPQDLLPQLEGLDALYVNFVSGFELTVDTAEWLRASFSGPIYTDLHSLFLAVAPGGLRTPRVLPQLTRWLRCFDAVQMNEFEFELFAEASGDPWRFAAGLVGGPLRLLLVTLGERGAAYVAAPDFEPDPFSWNEARGGVLVGRPAVSALIGAGPPVGNPDPTGCGDVWGATCFARLLAGDELSAAIREANRLGALNAGLRGATGLHLHLRGLLASGGTLENR